VKKFVTWLYLYIFSLYQVVLLQSLSVTCLSCWNSRAFRYRDSRGQAEKEFKVEVEAIGKVRHKNLVRLVGYCAEGARRYYSVYMAIILFTGG